MQNSRHTFRADKGPLHAQYRKNTFFYTKALLRRYLRVSLGPFGLPAQSGDHSIVPTTAMPSGVFPVFAEPIDVRAPAVTPLWVMEKTDTVLAFVLFVT